MLSGIPLTVVNGTHKNSRMTSPQKLRPQRAAGVLMHPSSFPGPFGIGDVGPVAMSWIDALVQGGQTWWQVLPLGPTGYGDSPYQCFSAFAGNPYLTSPELMIRVGLLAKADLAGASFPADRTDYGAVIPFKNGLLDRAWENYSGGAGKSLRSAFEQFAAEQQAWLDDYCLFMAIKDSQGGKGWLEWPAALRMHEKSAVESARREHDKRIGRHRFAQFLFDYQWQAVKRYAHERGIWLIGDAPIFVAGDSADVWANPQLFLLDRDRRQTVVAGVPPDYFSATGQLWGNPIYDWDAARADGYRWWIARLQATLRQVDVVRLDHFRGFAAAWHVPAGSATAENGAWVPGPGADLFSHLERALHGLPLVAEDLGLITADVDQLRKQFSLPGMRVLQFAFSDPQNKYLPHNFDEQTTVVYTGTHDNDTTCGWYSALAEKERDFIRRYLGRDGSDIAWDLIRTAWASVADLAITPLQDVLCLGSAARMNSPGKAESNWSWRLPEGQLTTESLSRIADLTDVYGRNREPKAPG
jgi:4-alpha-glucanotransferase